MSGPANLLPPWRPTRSVSAFCAFSRSGSTPSFPARPLIPVDPTLLLTVAGMVPFKPYLLGEETPPYPRAVSIQKCIRTEDIEVVGTTARHMTYFEMMGNFSFGDYFKEKAIPYAYDLMTEGFELDPDRLWYTVHLTDDEAAEIWLDGVGIPADRLQRRDRDNIWQMGVPGPAGPSSEIFYDRGPGYGPRRRSRCGRRTLRRDLEPGVHAEHPGRALPLRRRAPLEEHRHRSGPRASGDGAPACGERVRDPTSSGPSLPRPRVLPQRPMAPRRQQM